MLQVIQELSSSKADTLALLKTCKRFVDMCAPYLYHAIILSCGGGDSNPRPDIVEKLESQCSALLSDFDFGVYVKSLTVKDFTYVS